VIVSVYQQISCQSNAFISSTKSTTSVKSFNKSMLDISPLPATYKSPGQSDLDFFHL